MLHAGLRLGEEKKECGIFFFPKEDQKKTHRSHSSTTFVMLHLADCMTARWNIRAAAVLPFHPRPPSRTEGITLGANEKNKAIHCYFIPGSAKPQPNHSWLLTLSCLTGLRHTPLCQCLVQKMWRVEKWRSVRSSRSVMFCSKGSYKIEVKNASRNFQTIFLIVSKKIK